jgi:hypothetical protein
VWKVATVWRLVGSKKTLAQEKKKNQLTICSDNQMRWNALSIASFDAGWGVFLLASNGVLTAEIEPWSLMGDHQ